MRIKEGLINNIPQNIQIANSGLKFEIGKVFNVITNEKEPSEELFNKYGQWNSLGTAFYMNYATSYAIDDIPIQNLDSCKRAKPLFPQFKNYPLKGELILIVTLPSPVLSPTSDGKTNEFQEYYISVVNLWNNIHYNSQGDNLYLGKTFTERSDIRPLQPYEGDIIYEGRTGNGIRLGNTSKNSFKPNNYSFSGDNGDPIVLLSNGFKYDKNSFSPYIEDINKDDSSIYLTSTQTIKLNTTTLLNPITKPIELNKYNKPQIIVNSDRVVLSSKNDDIILSSQSNIGLTSNGPITMDSKDSVILNAPKIILGLNKDNSIPTEPILKGDKTVTWLQNLIMSLSDFASILSNCIATEKGTPLIEINQASIILLENIKNLLKQSEELKSTKNFTS